MGKEAQEDREGDPLTIQTYVPDGSGHCKRCGKDVKSGHLSMDPHDPGRVLVCWASIKDGADE